MCVVSMISEGWVDDYKRRRPNRGTLVPGHPLMPAPPTYTITEFGIPRSEFDALKIEVEELKKLLLAAKKFDEATGQKDCEKDDKILVLKQVAEALGVDLSEVFK